MTLLDKIHHLWEHVFWADSQLFAALSTAMPTDAEVLREYAHILGAEEVWLARIQQRTPHTAVWPEVSQTELESLIEHTHMAYRTYLATLNEADLDTLVSYTNSAGRSFQTALGDILLHVALHGQYHRGKVNVLLRQGGHMPVATDYIAFLRR